MGRERSSPPESEMGGGAPRTNEDWRGCRLLAENRDLTSKEWAITALISQGSTDVEIAALIHASEPLVKDHLRIIFEKTGCWNRTEVALWYLGRRLEAERRFSDRREADSKISDERQKGRRHPPGRSRRANEQHDLNLEE
jgi:DNA-binding CsgD family transcriptional regulator